MCSHNEIVLRSNRKTSEVLKLMAEAVQLDREILAHLLTHSDQKTCSWEKCSYSYHETYVPPSGIPPSQGKFLEHCAGREILTAAHQITVSKLTKDIPSAKLEFFQHMQFHLYFEKLLMKGRQHKSKDDMTCNRAEKDLSEVFQMNKLTACQRQQRQYCCKYQTESDIYRAGITLDELYLHIIYGITFNFDNGLIRIDWEHKTEDCIIRPDNRNEEEDRSHTMGPYNFQFECDWIGCSHRGTNKPFRTQVREYNLINTNDARTKIHSHIWSHTTRCVYACRCQRALVSKESLDIHRNLKVPQRKQKSSNLHQASIQWKCNACDYQSVRKSDLAKHITRKHTPLNICLPKKKFSCPFSDDCPFLYTRAEQLSNHRDVAHSEIDGYLCFCGHIEKMASCYRKHVKDVHDISLFRMRPEKYFYEYKFTTNGEGSKRFMTFYKLEDMKIDENGKHTITCKLPKQTSIIEIYQTIVSMFNTSYENQNSMQQ